MLRLVISAIAIISACASTSHSQATKGSREAAAIIAANKNQLPDGDFLKLYELDIGQTGFLREGSTQYNLVVFEIFSKDEMLIGLQPNKGKTPPIIIKGVATDGMVDGKRVSIDRPLKVTRTKKLGAETFFVLEPDPEREKTLLEAKEKLEKFREEAKSKAAEKADAAKQKVELKAKADLELKQKAAAEKADPEKVAAKAESDAARNLKYARQYITDGNRELAEAKLKEIISKWPATAAGKEAKELLKKFK